MTFPKEFAKRPIYAMVGSIKGLGVAPFQKFVCNFRRKQVQAGARKHVTKLNDVANGVGCFNFKEIVTFRIGNKLKQVFQQRRVIIVVRPSPVDAAA